MNTTDRRDRSSDLSSAPDSDRQLVVQMHGEPGSGKSTIARELGARLGAVVLDKDVTKAALLRSGISEQQAGPSSYEVYFAHAKALVAAGYSIVLDNPMYWESIEQRWFEILDAARSPKILIECVCPDRDELVHRLRSRESLESQMREPLDLVKHPNSRETQFQPRLTLDTTRALSDVVDEALAYVERLVATQPANDDQRPVIKR